MPDADLFGFVDPSTRARPTDPVTSHMAAASVADSITVLQALVLACLDLAGPGGLTDEELTERLAMRGSTARTRRSELVEKGLVVDSGRKRPIASGRLAAVWIHKEFAP